MELEQRVISVIKKNLAKKCEVTKETRLLEDLGIDSFDKLMIVAGFEDEFSITIDEDDFKDFVTVNDIVNKFNEKYNV